MSVWVLHQTLTADEETEILKRDYIFLPFDGLPDLSSIHSERACQNLLKKLNPDAPPETILLKSDRIWRQYDSITIDDVVAVPLPNIKQVALGHISGAYHYSVNDDGSDVHILPVKWHEKTFPISSFRPYHKLFTASSLPMVEVTTKEERVKILDKLPGNRNIFIKLKWIMLIFTAMYGLSFIFKMLK